MTFTHRQNSRIGSLLSLSGGMVSLLGLLITVGWNAHVPGLTRLSGDVPTQYNVAFCFLLTGIAFLAISRTGMAAVARACGAVIMVFSGASLLSFLLQTDFAVDELFSKHPFLLRGASQVIHLAPNSSLCFLLAAIAIFIMSAPVQAASLRVLAFLGSLMMAGALLFAFGYVGGVKQVYSWLRLLPMTVPSAEGFMLASLGIFGFVRREEKRRGVLGLGCFPVPVTFGALTLVGFLWLAFVARERQKLDEATLFRLEGLRQEAREALRAEVIGLVLFAHRPRETGDVPGETELDFFHGRFPAYRAVGRATGGEAPHWDFRQAGLDLSEGGELGREVQELEAVAIKQREPVVSSVSHPAGKRLLLAVIPRFRDGKKVELTIGVLGAHRIFEAVAQSYLLSDYSVSIAQGDSVLFDNGLAEWGVNDPFVRSANFDLYSLKWRVMLKPSPAFLVKERTVLPNVILLTGLLVVMLLAIVFGLAEAAFSRAVQAEAAYEQLKRASSERIAAERVLQDTQAQLRHSQKMEAVGRLAGGVAHDFNSFLTAINGFSEMAMQKLQPGDETVHSYLNEIRKAGEEAAAVTHQLLAFSRKQVLELKVIDLNVVVDHMKNLLQHLLGAGIAVELKLGNGLGSVKVDRGQMEQVIMNLAVNARDAIGLNGKITISTEAKTLEGGPRLEGGAHVDVKAGEYVSLTVRDTGCGMSPEVMTQIFEPFFTTKDVGKGTGLGMALVYGIVKQSEGYVFIESSPGNGTAISILLPKVAQSAQPGAAIEDSPPVVQAASGEETILVVELYL